MSEAFPYQEGSIAPKEGLLLPPMTLELAYSQSVLEGDFFNNFYPGIWPQGQKLKVDVTDEILNAARLLAQLDEVDKLTSVNRIKMPTRDQRLFVWLKDKGQCHYCIQNVHPAYGGLNPDHYKPFSSGGHTSTANLVCACNKCNLAKNQDDGEAFDRLAQHPNFKLYREAMYLDRMNKSSRSMDQRRIDQLVTEASFIMYPQG